MSNQNRSAEGRPSQAVMDILRAAGSSGVCEALGRRNFMSLRPVYPNVSIVGPALTIHVPKGDHLMMHVAFEQANEGDVLVLVPDASDDKAYFGDLMATAAQASGCAGLIADAGVRDIAELQTMGFPVWARAICPAGTDRTKLGAVNVTVTCAGVTVCPGDIIVADDDGVAVIPLAEIDSVISKAQARAAWEADIKARLAAGEPSLDVLNIRDLIGTQKPC